MCFIQMLCEDYEVFLEIAHVLKGLDVSILKGVLEHRSAKLWASFVIEVYIKDLFSTHFGVVVHQRSITYQSIF